MIAVVFADRDGNELAPLNTVYATAMLPVAGKPMLEHTLEILRQYKVSKVFLVTGEHSDTFKKHFADGHRWSMDIQYIRSRTGETPDEMIRRIGHQQLSYPFLALRGDIWNGHVEDHADLYCYEVIEPEQSINTLAWPHFLKNQNASHPGLLKHLKDYHALVIGTEQKLVADMAAKNLPSRLSLGIQAVCHLTNLESGSLALGHYSRLARSARCADTVVIGNHCIIDEGAKLADTLVMDGSYVGPGMDLKHAIVMGNQLIRVDLDIVCTIDEPFMLGESTLSNFNTTHLLERLLAAGALVALLPVWCWLSICTLVSRQALFTQVELTGKHQILTLPDFSSAKQMQHVLPKLLAIVAGQLHLFGREPEAGQYSEMTTPQPWDKQYKQLPVAWISPARLLVGKNADSVLVELTEIELFQKARIHYLLSCLYLLLKSHLFRFVRYDYEVRTSND